MNMDSFEYLRKDGSLIVGDVQQAVDKIMGQYELFDNTRFVAELVTGHNTARQNIKGDRIIWDESGTGGEEGIGKIIRSKLFISQFIDS
jgi:hypothetical protein